MNNQYHSLRGYISRQPTNILKAELMRLKCGKQEPLNQHIIYILTDILQQRGENTDVDPSNSIACW